MIQYKKHTLNNGLTVICNTDKSTTFACFNILYKVGSRNEDPDRTGFAHLFEHLMFSGSQHVEDYDRTIELSGGENNAFTTNDFTNYYITLPAANIETAFHLESDRMAWLNINQNSLDVQKHVVIEEFKERCINKPYGDIWLKLKPLVYKVHPYQWPTIGKTPDHIANATLEDVKNFYKKFYAPNNAIIAVSGAVEAERVFELAEKWFGDIPASNIERQDIPTEPEQQEEQRIILDNNNVPAKALYKVFHMPARTDRNYYVSDLISDILSEGDSSRLITHLVKERNIFSSIDAYITGDMDAGLFIFCGKLADGIDFNEAEEAINQEIQLFINTPIPQREFEKIIHKREAQLCFGEINYQNKAANLAFFEMLGNIELINAEKEVYENVTVEEMQNFAQHLFRKENCTTLHYKKR